MFHFFGWVGHPRSETLHSQMVQSMTRSVFSFNRSHHVLGGIRSGVCALYQGKRTRFAAWFQKKYLEKPRPYRETRLGEPATPDQPPRLEYVDLDPLVERLGQKESFRSVHGFGMHNETLYLYRGNGPEFYVVDLRQELDQVWFSSSPVCWPGQLLRENGVDWASKVMIHFPMNNIWRLEVGNPWYIKKFRITSTLSPKPTIVTQKDIDKTDDLIAKMRRDLQVPPARFSAEGGIVLDN